jgi:dihydrofolate reductase
VGGWDPGKLAIWQPDSPPTSLEFQGIPAEENRMRRVRYNVAASLDGFIAGPDGEIDWIPNDPSVDFAALFATVDTVLLGRRSYELTRGGPELWAPSTRVYVFSRTLQPEDHPGITIVADDASAVVEGLRAEAGDGEIWLFGGGMLFESLLAGGQVDSIEVTIVPILLGGGLPLLSSTAGRAVLTLTDTHIYPSGMVTLSYDRSGR